MADMGPETVPFIETPRPAPPPTRRQLRLGAGLAVLAIVISASVGLGLVWSERSREAAAQVAHGRALFEGNGPLAGRIAGHDRDLPILATRCSNCHQGGAGSGVAAAARAEGLAPRLDAAGLTQAQSRRGGPPSRYESQSLCTLLSTGVDPAHVLISHLMPRYRMTDTDCDALWAYLKTR